MKDYEVDSTGYDFETINFANVVPGDVILGSDNTPVTVVRTHSDHLPSSMFELEFEDGTTIRASGNHLWYCETSLDRSLHRRRIKDWRKLFGKLSEVDVADLMAVIKLDKNAEISLRDALDFYGVDSNSQDKKFAAKNDAIMRVLSSIGPVAEENVSYQDLETGEILPSPSIRLYDAKRVFQQFLALSERKYRKQWNVIVGRVVTTEELMLMEDVEIPSLRPLPHHNA